jgi:hypothetical protein
MKLSELARAIDGVTTKMRKIKGEAEKLSVPPSRVVMPVLEASMNTSNEQFTAANHQLYTGDRVWSASKPAHSVGTTALSIWFATQVTP